MLAFVCVLFVVLLVLRNNALLVRVGSAVDVHCCVVPVFVSVLMPIACALLRWCVCARCFCVCCFVWCVLMLMLLFACVVCVLLVLDNACLSVHLYVVDVGRCFVSVLFWCC